MTSYAASNSSHFGTDAGLVYVWIGTCERPTRDQPVTRLETPPD